MVALFAIGFFLVFLALLVGLVVYARWNYGLLEASGIPLIKPTFFLGSVPDLHKKIQTEEDIRRFKEFGPNWALYEGRSPTVYICDPEIAKLMFVKDLEHFYDRRIDHFHDPRIDEILDYLPGEKWRKMRKLQTVLFSSGKIKQYNKLLAEAAYDHVSDLRSRCQNGRVTVNTRDCMDVLSLDGIARVSFRVKLENVEDPNNHFFHSLKLLLGKGQEFNWLYSLSMTFPFLKKLAPSFQLSDTLFDTFRQIMFDRRREKQIECMQNPRETQEKCGDLADLLVECYEKLNSPEFRRLGITETTVLAQALNVAALDMVSATQTMMAYYLATNPQVQANVHQEIDDVISGKYSGRIDNETVNCLPYLSACVNETLRLAPPLIRPERVCNKDWTSPDGKIRIKKGVTVMTPLWAIHRNPEYFPDPERFEPERFLGERSEEAKKCYMPFGIGPRNCIGMRLALETLKVNMTVILRDFQYTVRQDTRIELKTGLLYLLQFHPVLLDMVLRKP